MVTGCIGKILLDAKVALRRLNGRMPERDLDLLDGLCARVSQMSSADRGARSVQFGIKELGRPKDMGKRF